MSKFFEDDPVVEDSQHSIYEHQEQDHQISGYNSGIDVDLDDRNIDINMEEDPDRDPIAILELSSFGSTTKINIFAGKEIRIGRDGDRYCDPRVSKNHFRVYSVVYDPTNLNEIQPLIYCEDLESTNGTYINSECIGMCGAENRAHLLDDGDIIEIKPFWKYRFCQLYGPTIDPVQSRQGDLQHFEDRYTITDRLLGTGQYGKVYLAKELSTSRQVACKIVDLNKAGDELPDLAETWVQRIRRGKEEAIRLHREIKLLAELSHPHIIDLKKAFVSNNFIYIFTELAPVGDLFSYCESHGGKLEDSETRVICRQLILALEYMHKKNIAHRDIKMENILVMQTYDFSCRVVLTDFGFANHVDPKTLRMKSRVGTEGYVAPEVEAAERTSDGYTLAADMWSLGAVTFTLLVGNSSLPREEYSQHSQQNIVQFVQGIKYGEYLTSRAIKFLRGLLIEDAKKRMTASQALQHMWFKKPMGEAVAIEEACKRINKYWKPRENFKGVIEDLPDRKMILQTDPPSNASPRARRKVPDINPYPFIGLDYRLNPRTQSSRGSILSNLKQREALFIVDKGYQDNQAKPVRNPHSHKQTPRVISIPAVDMFSAALTESAAQDSLAFGKYGEDDEEEEEDELSLVLTNIGENRFEGELQNSHDGRSNITLSGKPRTSDSIQIPRAKQPLLGSNGSVSRGARVNLAKKIPRHSGAKAYGDAVRQMMRQNHTLPARSRCSKETPD